MLWTCESELGARKGHARLRLAGGIGLAEPGRHRGLMRDEVRLRGSHEDHRPGQQSLPLSCGDELASVRAAVVEVLDDEVQGLLVGSRAREDGVDGVDVLGVGRIHTGRHDHLREQLTAEDDIPALLRTGWHGC